MARCVSASPLVDGKASSCNNSTILLSSEFRLALFNRLVGQKGGCAGCLKAGIMKILHTADWHLGRSLYGRKRYEEFRAFLDWLAECIRDRHVDALLVAGDIFDNSTPSHRAQELYYRFLCRVSASACRHVIITAGNHDSPSFLNAPRNLLKYLNVHVVGRAFETPADEVLVLSGEDGKPELIVCAVPYLRDREIRTVEAGENPEDKPRKLIEGIRRHYQAVCRHAEQKRARLGRPVPMVVMGHLFAAGGRTVEGDGVRELYVGSLVHVGIDVFPESIDYLALGHLHVPQAVASRESMRYSGSPLPMGFGEAEQQKEVLLVEFNDLSPTIRAIAVPRFQELLRLRGDRRYLFRHIDELKADKRRVWLEIIYDGDDVIADLGVQLEALAADSGLEILRVKNTRVVERALSAMDWRDTLEDLDVNDVFLRCLDTYEVPEAQRAELLYTYNLALTALHEDDPQAE